MFWMSLTATAARWVSSTEERILAPEQPAEVEMPKNVLVKRDKMKSGLDNANKRLD